MRKHALFTALALLSLFTGPTQAQGSDAPYLYYYSDVLNAFVIERADGTDSRVLGEGLMSPETNEVAGPGWSPSGEWFAWTSAVQSPAFPLFYGWIISADGSRRLTMLDDLDGTIEGMTWAQADDVMLVKHWDRPEDQPSYSLIDVDGDEIIATVETMAGLQREGFQIAFEDGNRLSIESPTTGEQFVFDLDSVNAHSESVSRDSVPSPNGRYSALLGAQKIIIDTISGSTIVYLPHSRAAAPVTPNVLDYRWSPNSEWVIIVENATYAGGGGPDAISVFQPGGLIRRELTVCYYAQNCADWLPQRVIPYLASGNAAPVLSQPALILPHENNVTGIAWSPDGSQLATYDGTLHIWDMVGESPRLITQISDVGPCGEWLLPCPLDWNPNGNLIAVSCYPTRNRDWTIEVWDVTTGTLYETLDGYFGWWSSDDTYIVEERPTIRNTTGNWIARVWQRERIEVVDLQSGETMFSFPLGEGRWGDNVITMLEWMPDSHGLVINYDCSNDDGIAGIAFWDLASGQVVRAENSLPTLALDVSPDGRLVAGISPLLPVHIWDTTNGALLGSLNWYARDVEFSPDGTQIVTGGNSPIVAIWDMESIILEP